VSDFWDHSVSLQPCDKYDAEKGGLEATVSSICSGKVPRCRKDEGVCGHGPGARTAGQLYHRFHGQRLFPCRMDKHVKQNAYYCGYDCDTMVNNVFAYGPNGKVFFAAINFLGSWAGGSLTAHFLGHLKAKIGDYKICVNQGFPRSGDAYGTLVGPVMKRATRRLHHGVRDYLLWISNVHTLLRQASEWGMRGLQGTFPCCKKCLPSDSEQQRLVLEAIVLVHNF
jgi:hypothetical protein